MSYFVVGVGGTGAKLVQSLVHLSAAGLLPEPERPLRGMLVDPDDANGNVDEAKQVAAAYALCQKLKTGDECPLFKRTVNIREPWTPIHSKEEDTLDIIFETTQRQKTMPTEADLLELFFSEEERSMSLQQGFRGRPAIGATVLAEAVDFDDPKSRWADLKQNVEASKSFPSGVPILVTGSVFGGTGAAGVPTILQKMRRALKNNDAGDDKIRLGLTLFLPYFRFKELPDEKVQADPNAFVVETVEALKYYHENEFLSFCDAIYAVGERDAAEMRISAVGSAAQRNEPHFIELVAALGAVRFFGGQKLEAEEPSVSLAVRKNQKTLDWLDLPVAEALGKAQLSRLRQMILFAVVFSLKYHDFMVEELDKKSTRETLLVQLVERENLSRDTARIELAQVRAYTDRFLTWLMHLSTTLGGSCQPALVDANIFAEQDGTTREWRLRKTFHKPKDLRGLFRDFPLQTRPDLGDIWKTANKQPVNDQTARGTGRVLRAIYDACEL